MKYKIINKVETIKIAFIFSLFIVINISCSNTSKNISNKMIQDVEQTSNIVNFTIFQLKNIPQEQNDFRASPITTEFTSKLDERNNIIKNCLLQKFNIGQDIYSILLQYLPKYIKTEIHFRQIIKNKKYFEDYTQIKGGNLWIKFQPYNFPIEELYGGGGKEKETEISIPSELIHSVDYIKSFQSNCYELMNGFNDSYTKIVVYLLKDNESKILAVQQQLTREQKTKKSKTSNNISCNLPDNPPNSNKEIEKKIKHKFNIIPLILCSDNETIINNIGSNYLQAESDDYITIRPIANNDLLVIVNSHKQEYYYDNYGRNTKVVNCSSSAQTNNHNQSSKKIKNKYKKMFVIHNIDPPLLKHQYYNYTYQNNISNYIGHDISFMNSFHENHSSENQSNNPNKSQNSNKNYLTGIENKFAIIKNKFNSQIYKMLNSNNEDHPKDTPSKGDNHENENENKNTKKDGDGDCLIM